MAAANSLALAFSCVRLGMSKMGKEMGWIDRNLREEGSGCVGGHNLLV